MICRRVTYFTGSEMIKCYQKMLPGNDQYTMLKIISYGLHWDV